MSAGGNDTLNVALAGQVGDFSVDAAFEAPLHGVTALYGPSGSGKTTVLRGIAGLGRLRGRCALGRHVWQDGAIFVPPHRRAIGYVFQEPSLFSHLSVRANLMFGLHRAPGKHAVGFDSVVQLLGLWKLLDRSTANLSGGERQRVSLGRALLSQPRLLLLDEPMSALDRAAKEELLPYLEALHRSLSIPIILVSHDIAEVERLADVIVAMRAGRVVARGSTAEMLLSDALGLKRGKDAASVLTGTVRYRLEEDWLTEIDIGGEALLVTGMAGAVGDRVRVRIAARDVSLAITRPTLTTILNVLPATIAAVDMLPAAEANVTLTIGDAVLLARVTHRSVALLDLRAGIRVFAQVKGVSVVTAPE